MGERLGSGLENVTRLFRDAAAAGRDTVPAEEVLALAVDGDVEPAGLSFRLGIRNTREFGPVISAGPAGTEADLLAAHLANGCISATAAAELTDARRFLERFQQCLPYKQGAGIGDEPLLALFVALIGLARHYSPVNAGAPFIIESLDFGGDCRFREPAAVAVRKPIGKIGKLLHPDAVGIIGVSASKMNFGRIILKNVVASGYPSAKLTIIKPGADREIDGVRCVQELGSLEQKLDLLIVAVGADAAFRVVDDVLATDAAEAVLLVSGGLGETEASRGPALAMAERINAARAKEGGGPVFLGGNCLGVVSHPGNFNSWFIPRELLPGSLEGARRGSAMVSQSGAFMITRLSKNAWLDPAYMVAVGNQNDLTHGDMLRYFATRDDIDVVAFYIEGFRDFDGLAFAEAAGRAIASGKQVVVYKAGRSAAGQDAAMGHTASIAGDYDLCVSLLSQAGVMVAATFTEFTDLFYIASMLRGKTIRGDRLAAVSGAGFETVGIADSSVAGDLAMRMADVSEETAQALGEILKEKRLDALMEIRNPFDINPGADDDTHIRCAEVFANDPNVDAIVVGLDPLSPVTRTLDKSARKGFDIHSEESLASTFAALADRHDKPIVGIIEGGPMFEPFAAKLMDQGACVFRSTERGMKALVRYTAARLRSSAVV